MRILQAIVHICFIVGILHLFLVEGILTILVVGFVVLFTIVFSLAKAEDKVPNTMAYFFIFFSFCLFMLGLWWSLIKSSWAILLIMTLASLNTLNTGLKMYNPNGDTKGAIYKILYGKPEKVKKNKHKAKDSVVAEEAVPKEDVIPVVRLEVLPKENAIQAPVSAEYKNIYTRKYDEASAEEFAIADEYTALFEEQEAKGKPEDRLLLEAMADVNQGSTMEAEDKTVQHTGKIGKVNIPKRFARVQFVDGKLVSDGYKTYKKTQTYDYLCDLEDIKPGDYVTVFARSEYKRAKVVEIFSKPFNEMPLPEWRYSKVVCRTTPFEVDEPAHKNRDKCRCVKVKFWHGGKSYSYRCEDESIGVGDFVRVMANGEITTVKVVSIFYAVGFSWKSVLGEASVAQIKEVGYQFPEIQERYGRECYNDAYADEEDEDYEEEEDPFDREMALAEAEEKREFAENQAVPRQYDFGVSMGTIARQVVLNSLLDGLNRTLSKNSSNSGINDLPEDYRTNRKCWHHPDNIYFEEYLDEGDCEDAADNWESVTGMSREEYYEDEDC